MGDRKRPQGRGCRHVTAMPYPRLVHTLRRPQLDGELDEVAVLADELLQLEVRADVVRLLPYVQRDLRAPHEVLAAGVWLHGVSGAPGLALPDPLLALLVALCLNPHPVST